MTGFDAVMKLLDADSATTNAKAVGLPPAARAMLIASGTMTIAAPTWLITSENAVVSKPSASCSSQRGVAPGICSIVWPATQAAAPLESIAQPSGIRQAIRNTVFQLIAEYASSMWMT